MPQVNAFFDRIKTQLALLGFPTPWMPRDVQVGPFQAVSTVPDNTDAAQDLTAGAVWAEDRQMTQILGATANKPRVIMYVVGVRAHLDYTLEPNGAQVQHTLRSRLYLEHQASGDIRRIYSLGDQLVDSRSGVAIAADAQAAPFVQIESNGADESYQQMPYPWIVDLSVDQFTLKPSTPTNVANVGGVPITLTFYGVAFQSQSLSANDFRDLCNRNADPTAVIQSAMLAQRLGRR